MLLRFGYHLELREVSTFWEAAVQLYWRNRSLSCVSANLSEIKEKRYLGFCKKNTKNNQIIPRKHKETNITKPLCFFWNRNGVVRARTDFLVPFLKKNIYGITRQYMLSASVIMLSTSHLMLFIRNLMEKWNLLEFWQWLAQDNAGSFGCLKAWSQVLFWGYCVIWKEALFFIESLGHVVTCGRSCIDSVWKLVGFWGGWREKKLKSLTF